MFYKAFYCVCVHQHTTNFIYIITRTEIGFTDRPLNIRNFENTILPIMKILYFGLIIIFCSSSILGCKQKCQIEPLQYRLEVSSWVVNDASPPTMSKELEWKTESTRAYNIHHSMRDQTKQRIRARFSKGREKSSFQQSTSNRVVLGLFIKTKDKKRS